MMDWSVQPRVALTGASSYTGACVAEALARAGARVFALCHRALSSYQGVKALRLKRVVNAGATLVGELSAEDGRLAAWVRTERLDVWLHHHHFMEDFRARDYRLETAEQVALLPLPALFDGLTSAGVRHVIHSGTYFEPGEGGPLRTSPATPYAEHKARTFRAVEEGCRERGLALTKIVIPAPIGALENEDRLTPQVIRAAERGEPFSLGSPGTVMDVIPGEVLAEVYVRAALAELSGLSAPVRVLRPSGWVVTVQAWIDWVREQVLTPLGLESRFQLDVKPRASWAADVHFENPVAERLVIDWPEVGARYAREWPERSACEGACCRAGDPSHP